MSGLGLKGWEILNNHATGVLRAASGSKHPENVCIVCSDFQLSWATKIVIILLSPSSSSSSSSSSLPARRLLGLAHWSIVRIRPGTSFEPPAGLLLKSRTSNLFLKMIATINFLVLFWLLKTMIIKHMRLKGVSNDKF